MSTADVFSWLGTIFALMLVSSPIQTLRLMWAADSIGPRTINIFSALSLNGLLWCEYGILLQSAPIILCNGVAFLINAVGQLVFLRIARREEGRGCVLDQTSFSAAMKTVVVAFSLCFLSIIGSAAISQPTINTILGSIGSLTAILVYLAPLDVVKTIIATRCSEALTPFTTFSGLLCSGCWMTFGFLVSDYFILVPNAIGFLLSIVQSALILKYPRTSPGIQIDVPKKDGGAAQKDVELSSPAPVVVAPLESRPSNSSITNRTITGQAVATPPDEL